MLLVFSLTLFIGAALTFLVQPMVAKMLLPLFGGAPAVWTTCILFFQFALLAGYSYAHALPRVLGVRRHALFHLLLMVIPVFLLPITITADWAPPSRIAPVLWLLWILFAVVGLPFFVVTATAPLLQKWFGSTSHPLASDPYFLYAASNLGSILSLLCYPLLIEPLFVLPLHSWIWSGGYLALGVLMVCCFLLLWRSTSLANDNSPSSSVNLETPVSKEVPASSWKQRLHWLLLAFIPSSLMLSVTTYLTTDLAAIPLLWITPLTLYLLTFILAFARRQPISHRLINNTMPLFVLILTIAILTQATEPVFILMILHLAGFFIIALFCHRELALARPPVEHLTEFYLWMSLGGVLGGAFNAVLAPMLFNGVWEYPIALVLGCLLRRPAAQKKQMTEQLEENAPDPELAVMNAPEKPSGGVRTVTIYDLIPLLLLGLITVCLIFLVPQFWPTVTPETFPMFVGSIYGVPFILCYTFIERPIRFGTGIAVLFLTSVLIQGVHGQHVYADRSFFGIHRITLDRDEHLLKLVHGNTVHGQQSTLKEKSHIPLTYYHPTGPIGNIFSKLEELKVPINNVGLVGLGVGSLAAYGKPGQRFTFYEIDPVVIRIARDLDYFTYWKNSKADLSVVLGDARLKLAEAENEKYDLIIIDAFNSDAIPVHLLTREAMQVYQSRLRKGGVIAFHISNRYLKLQPVVAELAHDANMPAYSWNDGRSGGTSDENFGRYPSHWVVLTRNSKVLEWLRKSILWEKLSGGQKRFLWTDEYSSVLNSLDWFADEETSR